MHGKVIGAKPPKKYKTTSWCPIWFTGGPHSWNIRSTPCPVVRQQKPPYQHKTTAYHEWGKDGRCIHCHKTKQEVRPKPSPTDVCLNCGITRAEAQLTKPKLVKTKPLPKSAPKPTASHLVLVASDGKRLK